MWNPEVENNTLEEHKQNVLSAAKRVLERPFISLGKPLVSLSVRSQFRYAIEYLVREGYPKCFTVFMLFIFDRM